MCVRIFFIISLATVPIHYPFVLGSFLSSRSVPAARGSHQIPTLPADTAGKPNPADTCPSKKIDTHSACKFSKLVNLNIRYLPFLSCKPYLPDKTTKASKPSWLHVCKCTFGEGKPNLADKYNIASKQIHFQSLSAHQIESSLLFLNNSLFCFKV